MRRATHTHSHLGCPQRAKVDLQPVGLDVSVVIRLDAKVRVRGAADGALRAGPAVRRHAPAEEADHLLACAGVYVRVRVSCGPLRCNRACPAVVV
eukprot:5971707-Prymnesium_polylepis.2